MPRPKKNMPSVFDAEEPQPGSSASAREENGHNKKKAIDPAGSPPADEKEAIPASPPAADPPPVGAEKKSAAKNPKKQMGPVERRKLAEDEAGRYIKDAVEFIGQVAEGSKKITNWTNVPERLRAAQAIIDLAAGKNPIATQLDKGRPMLLIARSPIRPGTEHVLPPDYTPPIAA